MLGCIFSSVAESERALQGSAKRILLHHFLPEGLHKRPEGKRGEKSVDVVVTSSPYNIGIGHGSFNDALPREKYLVWMEEVGVAIKWALADDGSCFVKIDSKPKDQWIAWNVTSGAEEAFCAQEHHSLGQVNSEPISATTRTLPSISQSATSSL